MSTLPDDFYHHVEPRHSLGGQRWGRVYRLGDRLRVRLVEATPMTGCLILALDEAEGDAPARDAGSRAGSREGGADRRPRGTARKKAQGPASSKKADESRAKSEGSTRPPGAKIGRAHV